MKKGLQILIALLVITSTASAQWVIDSVSMGAGYSNNIFYSLGSAGGIQKTEPSSNWHLAFSMNALDSASVMANQQGSLADYVKVYNIHRPVSDWANVALSDTATADTLYNGSAGWYQGAFNQINNASAFNYGWGTYNIVTHKIAGDSLFIVKTGNDFYKLSIDSLNPITYDWYIRLQKMDLIALPQAYTISRSSGYTNRLFAYFNLDSAQAYDREPDVNSWDFEFIQYPTYIQAGPNTSWRGVTGALHNRGRAVAEARNIEVDAAQADYMAMMPGVSGPAWINGWESTPYTEIGYDWKVFNMGTFQYDIPDSLSYFVSSVDDTVYQLQFLEFPGGASGNIKFRYRAMGSSPVAVTDYDVFAKASIYPNPASNQVNFLFNASKATEATLQITSMNGQTVYQAAKKVDAGLNAWQINTSNLTAGHYIVTLSNRDGMTYQKMTISQ